MTSTEDPWFWCMHHAKAEQGPSAGCAPDQRLGPYPSKDAAEHWKESVDARNESWDAEDRAWEGDDSKT